MEVRQTADPREEKKREALEALLTRVEGQAFYTSVMTDTYLEDEEDAYEQDSD